MTTVSTPKSPGVSTVPRNETRQADQQEGKDYEHEVKRFKDDQGNEREASSPMEDSRPNLEHDGVLA